MRLPSFLIRLGKYCISSSLAVGIDFALLLLLVENFSWNYLWAATVSFTAGHSVNYFISRHWNFYKTDREHKVAYLLFVGFGLVGLALTILVLRYFVEGHDLHYMTARIVTGLIVGFCNFIFNYYVTFKAHLIPDDVDKF